MVARGAPALAVGDAEVGGEQVELFPVGRTDERRIAHALVADGGAQHGLGVVEVGPVEAVLADREVDLLTLRGFAGEVGEEVGGGGLGRRRRRGRRGGDRGGGGGAGGDEGEGGCAKKDAEGGRGAG